MNIEEFYNHVEADPEIEGISLDKDVVVVGYKKYICTISMGDIFENTWDSLKNYIMGIRDEIVINHYSRVVGYYSNISNWNNSKIGELKDRQKGNYAITSGASDEAEGSEDTD